MTATLGLPLSVAPHSQDARNDCSGSDLSAVAKRVAKALASEANSFSPQLAPWLHSEAPRLLGEMALLQEDWDSYGAKPVSVDAIVRSFELLSSIVSSSTPKPSLTAYPSGGVFVEWEVGSDYMEILVGPASSAPEVEFELSGATTVMLIQTSSELDLVRNALTSICE